MVDAVAPPPGMCGARVLLATSLAAAALLLLSALQQDSPLRPTPLAIRRPLPAPLDHNEVHPVAHNENHVAHNENQVAHGEDGAIASDKSITGSSTANNVPQSEVRQSEKKNESERRQPTGVNETHSEPATLLQSDVATNISRPVVAPKKDTSGAVLTRALYVSGHVWTSASVCPALGRRLRVLVLVTSATTHAAQRHAARTTWARPARTDLALAFYIGIPPAHLLPELEAERDLYGDLIMGNFVDSYRNLTLKTISMLEWTYTYCPLVPRILKTDDDMFINIPRLLEFLQPRANHTMTIWGRVVRRWLPNRNPNSKYYLPKKQYPDKVLPAFATGPAYLMTQDAVRPLYSAATARDVAFLSLEDVAVTGVAARRAHVRLVSAAEFVNKHVRVGACALRRVISLHMVGAALQHDLWRTLHAGTCKD